VFADIADQPINKDWWCYFIMAMTVIVSGQVDYVQDFSLLKFLLRFVITLF
jgi:hypothetical protein